MSNMAAINAISCLDGKEIPNLVTEMKDLKF
jgi:hypothetical protein